MKTVSTVFIATVAVGISVLAGCNGAVSGNRHLLTVDFQQARSLRYRFVSTRDIEIDWTPAEKESKPAKSRIKKSFESVEMVVVYRPVEIDPYGLTTIEASCKSVRARRSLGKGRWDIKKDAVSTLRGRAFTFTVDAAGKIHDYSQLESLLHETGERAFRPESERGRIKEPDMIADFFATQWFLWDAVSSIGRAAEGVCVGQTWRSKLSVPLPMVLQKSRDVSYTLDEIRQTEKGRLGVIKSSYALCESVPPGWPMPYTGKFQVSGTFGMLGGYKVLDLQGTGKQLFNIDAGRIERYNQEYRIKLSASFPFGFGVHPEITIKQKLTMEFLGIR